MYKKTPSYQPQSPASKRVVLEIVYENVVANKP